MANNQAEFDAIVESINNGSFSDRHISLSRKGINDLDVANLMYALQNNPEIASNILEIRLSINDISIIAIPGTLIALRELILENNQLVSIEIPDTLIALKRINLSNNQLICIRIPGTLIMLRGLLLHNNQLSIIEIPNNLTGLTYLGITNNPLTLVSRYGLAVVIRSHYSRRLFTEIQDELNDLPPFTKEVLHAEYFGNPEDPEQLMSKALTINHGMLSAYRNSLLTLSVKRSGLIRPELPTAVINNILSFVYVPYNYLPKLTVHRDLFPASSQERQLFYDYIKQTEEKIIPYLDRQWNYKILSLPELKTQEHRLSGTKQSHSSAGIT